MPFNRLAWYGGTFGLELVATCPRGRVSEASQFAGWAGAGGSIALVETVRRDRSRRLTIFDQEFAERRGSKRDAHQGLL